MAFLLLPEIQNVILRDSGNVEIDAAAEELAKSFIISRFACDGVALSRTIFYVAALPGFERVKFRLAVFMKAVSPRAPKDSRYTWLPR